MATAELQRLRLTRMNIKGTDGDRCIINFARFLIVVILWGATLNYIGYAMYFHTGRGFLGGGQLRDLRVEAWFQTWLHTWQGLMIFHVGGCLSAGATLWISNQTVNSKFFSLCYSWMISNHDSRFGLLVLLYQSNCILVKGSYLTDLADRGDTLQRRQEVPEEAIIHGPSSTIWKVYRRAWREAVREKMGPLAFWWWIIILAWFVCLVMGAYSAYSSDAIGATSSGLIGLIGLAEHIAFTNFYYAKSFVVVVISYLWLDPEHPDVNGDQLKFLSKMLKSYSRGDAIDLESIAVFIDFTSMYQHTPQYFPCTILDTQVEGETTKIKVQLTQSGKIIKVDPSLLAPKSSEPTGGPQASVVGDAREVRIPRDSAEDKSFKRCLKESINLLYGSRWSNVWMLTRPPDRPGKPCRRYDESGWCSTERAVSSLIKGSKNLLDLGIIYHATLEKEAEDIDWKVDVVRCCVADRRPPLSPSQFNDVIRGLRFQSGADTQVVQRVYDNAYNATIKKVRVLVFSELSWTEGDIHSLSTTLRDCRCLLTLDLSSQDITDEGMAYLLTSLKALGQLERLNLSNTSISHTFVRHVWKSLPNLKLLEWSAPMSADTDSTISV